MTCAESTNALNNTLLDTDDFARQIKNLCGSTSVDSKPTPELHVINELLPGSMEETHKQMYDHESFMYADAVKRGSYYSEKKEHPHGIFSQVIHVKVHTYGLVPINVYSNDLRSDLKLAKQAYKNYKNRKRKKNKEKKLMDCSLDPLSMNDNVIPSSYANALMADSIPITSINESIPMLHVD